MNIHSPLTLSSQPPLSPAQRVIKAFGGVRATARIIGRNSSTVSRWQKPRDQGGTGGRVPSSAQGVLLDYARQHGIELSAEDLIA